MNKRILLLALVLALFGGVKSAHAQAHTVALTWVAPVATPGITVFGYYLYRESAPGACVAGGTGNCVVVNTTPTTALTLTDATPPVGNVWYVVRAIGTASCAPHSTGFCESNNSNEVQAVVPAPGVKPPPPTGLAPTVQ